MSQLKADERLCRRGDIERQLCQPHSLRWWLRELLNHSRIDLGLGNKKLSFFSLSLIFSLCFSQIVLFLPVDGVWNEWSSWSSCSVSCSNGTMQRTRECNGPSYGGSECQGEWLQMRDCFLRECPVDGQWQQWNSWSSCTKTCGGGSQQRQRVCYGPFFAGEPCPGDRMEIQRCSEKRCPGKMLVLSVNVLLV